LFSSGILVSYFAAINLGRYKAISGKIVKIVVVNNIKKKNGKAYLAISVIGSPVRPFITKRLNPTGGVIWLTSTINPKISAFPAKDYL